jgi:hypothetical protein
MSASGGTDDPSPATFSLFSESSCARNAGSRIRATRSASGSCAIRL